MGSRTIGVTEQWSHEQWWSQTTIWREQWEMYEKREQWSSQQDGSVIQVSGHVSWGHVIV